MEPGTDFRINIYYFTLGVKLYIITYIKIIRYICGVKLYIITKHYSSIKVDDNSHNNGLSLK